MNLIGNGDFHGGFSQIIENRQAVSESEIDVERINSPMLLVSSADDEV